MEYLFEIIIILIEFHENLFSFFNSFLIIAKKLLLISQPLIEAFQIILLSLRKVPYLIENSNRAELELN